MVIRKLQLMEKAIEFCKYLEKNGITYDLCIKHKEVLGCNDSEEYYRRFQYYLEDNYSICKNLLVHEQKGEKRNFLLITDSTNKIDLNSLKDTLDCKKLEFVNKEEMEKLLNTTPGNVSLFNLIYDKLKKVQLVIDEELFFKKQLAFHPLYNGMSLFLKPDECLKFLELINRNATIVCLPKKDNLVFEKKKAM